MSHPISARGRGLGQIVAVLLFGLVIFFLFNSSAFAQAGFCERTPRAIAADDFNGDGKLDVAAVRLGSGSVFVYPGDGGGGLGTPTPIGSGLLQPTSLVVGDFVAGGGPDIAVAGFLRTRNLGLTLDIGLAILNGDGAGNFVVSQRFLGSPTLVFPISGLPIPNIIAGDFNGDGRQDLAVTDGSSGVFIFLQPAGGFVGTGLSTFNSATAVQASFPFGLTDITVGNFNGDTKLDLAAAIAVGNPFQVAVRFGESLTRQETFETGGIGPQAMATGDFNEDGNLDLAVLHFESNDLSILLGDGTGNFSLTPNSPISLPAGDNGASLVPLDFDGDGNLDLAVASTGDRLVDNGVLILLGDGQGDFSPGVEFGFNHNQVVSSPRFIGFPPRSIASGDFDNNGAPDLAASFFCSNDVKILLNPLSPPDTTPPTLTCSVSPDTLWPPNHKMVAVNATVIVSDTGSGPAGFTLTSATSNEPDEGLGDGDFPNDIQGFVVGTPDTSGLLRAERSGIGNGRVYTLTYEGMDLAGNSATCSVTVTVPHDQRK